MVAGKEGIRKYYVTRIEHLETSINDKARNLQRLEAQRNALNAKGTLFLWIGFM
jgi:26S proteasome regulatory subunit T6